MSWLSELVDYLSRGRKIFREQEAESASKAEEAFQASIQASEEVARGSKEVRNNSDFIREVLRGHA